MALKITIDKSSGNKRISWNKYSAPDGVILSRLDDPGQLYIKDADNFVCFTKYSSVLIFHIQKISSAIRFETANETIFLEN